VTRFYCYGEREEMRTGKGEKFEVFGFWENEKQEGHGAERD
jgi:hypothetical protein